MVKKVVITGVNGKIGGKLKIFLENKGWEVVGFGRKEGGLENKEKLKKVLEGIEYVIHLAVYQNYNDVEYKRFYDVNVNGCKNLLNSVDRKHIKKVIYFSSEVVFDKKEEMGNYARSKKEALEIVKKYQKKLPLVIVYPGVVLDKNNNPTPQIWWQRILWTLAGGFPGAIATLINKKNIRFNMIDDLVKETEKLLRNMDIKLEYWPKATEMKRDEYRKFAKNLFEKIV